MFRNLIAGLLKKDRNSSLTKAERRAAFLKAIHTRTAKAAGHWTSLSRSISQSETRRSGGAFQTTRMQLEALEPRIVLAYDIGGDLHDHTSGVDAPFGVFTPEEIAAAESVPADSALSTKTPPLVAGDGAPHESDPLTIVLDFNESHQGNTSDVFGNQVSTFDPTAYGFAAGDTATIADAVLDIINVDYFNELVGTVAGPAGQDLAIDFIIGDIGTAPTGITEYYFIQIGEYVSGPHGGFFGVASTNSVRNSGGTGPNNGLAIGDVVGSVFTEAIQGMGSLTPSNALSIGNLTFTSNAIAGTTSHEIGHTVSLSHVNKAASVQPTGLPPIMGTGAIDLPNQDRIANREFSLSGFNAEDSGAPIMHIQQLTDAIGLHDIPTTSIELNGTTLEIFDIDDPSNDDLRIRLTAGGTNLEIFDPSNVLGTSIPGATGAGSNTLNIPIASLAGVTLIDVDGGGGNDTLTLDMSGGLLTIPVDYDGGAGFDDLVVQGDPGGGLIQRETYIVGATEDAGRWVLDPDDVPGNGGLNGNEAIIDFRGLEPVDSFVPAAIFDVILTPGADLIDIENGGPGPMGVDTTQVTDVGGTFETFRFANKTVVRISGNGDADGVSVNNSVPATGLQNLEIYGHVAPGLALPADDDAPDMLSVDAIGAGLNGLSLNGQGGDDFFLLGGGSASLDLIDSSVTIVGGEGGETPGIGDEALVLDAASAADGDSPAAPSTINPFTLTNFAPAPILYFELETLDVDSQDDFSTEMAVLGTAAGTETLVHLGVGPVSNAVVVGNTPLNAFDGNGDLDPIQGPIIFEFNDAALRSLQVDDTGDLTGDVGSISEISSPFTQVSGDVTAIAGFSPAPIHYASEAGVNGSEVDFLDVITGQGDDTINVGDTTALVATNVDAFQGDDSNTITINADGLTAANTFSGNTGNDAFVLNVTANIGGTSLQINGDAPAGTLPGDQLEINDVGAPVARTITVSYPDGGDDGSLTVSGFAIPIDITTMEQVEYNGDGADDDLVTVDVTDLADTVFVDPTGLNSADLFVGGVPPVNAGVLGGGAGPDLRLDGVDTLQVDGQNPTGPLPADQLFVDVNGGTGTVQLVPTAAGFVGLLSVPGQLDVAFTNFETLIPVLNGGTVDVRVRWDLSPLGNNGVADGTLLVLDPSGDNLVIDANGMASVIQIPVTLVNSLRIDGSGDDDDLFIDDVNGLPSFTGTVPGVGDNNNIPGLSELAFNGAGGDDGVNFNLVNAQDQTYAVGNGLGAGSGVGTSTGEILTEDNVAGTDLQLWFTGLEPITTSGTPGGTLTVLGDTNANTIDILPGPAGFTRIAATNPIFETFDFAANSFSQLAVFGMENGDTIDLQGFDPAEVGLVGVRLDGDTNTNTDGSADVIAVRSTTNLPNTSVISMYGGAGGDAFILDSTPGDGGTTGTVDGIGALVEVASVFGEEASANDSLTIVDTNGVGGKTVRVRSSSIGEPGANGITANDEPTLPDITYGLNDQIETISIFSSNNGAAGETFNVQSTRSGSVYHIATQGGNDAVNVSGDAPNLLTPPAELDAILGQINLDTGAGVDALNVSDYGAGVADTYGLTQVGPNTQTAVDFNGGGLASDILYNSNSLGVNPANNPTLENFRLIGSETGDNTYNINDTTATIMNVIEDGDATTTAPNNGTFNIAGDELSANNVFRGFDGNDQFNLNITTHIGQNAVPGGTIASVEIHGNDPSPDNANRDRVTINDNNNGFAREVNYDYLDTAADLNIAAQSAGAGLFGPNGGGLLPLQIRTMETVIFNSGATNDTVRVTGTSSDDDLTVALLPNNSSAVVFLNGSPYTEAPPDSLVGFFPGVAGGGNGPDLYINGMDGDILLDGAGTDVNGNRAIVQAASEADLTTPDLVDYFGFGVGVLLPGFGGGDAYDTIDVNNTVPNRVITTNNLAGTLLNVDVLPGSFVNTMPVPPRPGLIVNAGDEAVPQANGVADNITAAAHPQFNIQVNGNLPGLAFGLDGLPIGDQLNLISPTSFNIWSDKETPPNVSIFAGNDDFGIFNSSIERTLLAPGNGVINLIGDQNNAAVDQTDRFVVVGRDVDGNPADQGYQEGTLSVNGSSPILLDGVQFLNVFGFDLQGVADLRTPGINPPGAVDNPVDGPGANDIDTLEVTPYADNTPRGWGIHVNFNEGVPNATDPVPDGDPVDLLIYHTSLFGGPVSEDIVVQPSAVDAGQLYANNSATGTPIVVINYLANTDVRVLDDDGFASDTDTLTLNGTNPDTTTASGQDVFAADFTNAGNAAEPLVTVTDEVSGLLLYRLQNMSGFDTINFNGLGGDDTFGVVGRADGSLTVNVDGGDPVASDTIVGDMTTGVDTYQVNPGASSDSGNILQQLDGAGTPTTINFVNAEAIDLGSLGAGTQSHPNTGDGGADQLTFNGTGGDDLMTLAASAGASLGTVDGGRVWVNDQAVVSFDDLGDGSDLSFNGGTGDDDLYATHVSAWEIDDVAFNGGPPTASDSFSLVGTLGADDFDYTASASNVAQIDLTSGGTTSNYILSNVESAAIDALNDTPNPTDTLDVTTASATITPGADPGAGRVDPVDASGNALLSLDYARVETAAVTGTTAVIQGTNENDTITVTAAGLVTVTNSLGFSNSVDVSAFAALVINANGGDDSISIASSGLFANGITVLGGDNGTGSDLVTVADPNVLIDLASNTLTNVVAGTITLSGVEDLVANGADGSAEAFAITGYGAASDIQSIVIDGGDTGNDDGDLLDVTLAAGAQSVTFRPTSISSAELTGGTQPIHIQGFNNAAGGVTINAAASVAELTFIDSAGDDTVTANDTSAVTNVGGNDWVPVDWAGVDALNLDGPGNDAFTVTPGAIPIFVDGGTPVGAVGDTITINVPAGAGAVTVHSGPESDEGAVTFANAGFEVVSFDHIEQLTLNNAGAVTVCGTHDADQITVLGTGAAAANVWVNSSVPLILNGLTSLAIDAKSGDDNIDVDAGALALGAGNFTVDGGSPNADADIVTVVGATPTWAPTSASGGQLTVDTQRVDISNVEGVVYDGESANAVLTVQTPVSATPTITTLTPSLDDDSGSLQVGSLVPFSFEDLGSTGSVVMDDLDAAVNDVFVYNGTDGNDLFTVSNVAVVSLNTRIAVDVAGDVAALTLNGLDGDDTFDVNAGHGIAQITLAGGNPSASDTARLVGDGSTIDVNLGDTTPSTTGGGLGTVNFTSIEHALVGNLGGDIEINGTLGPDTIEVQPVNALSATVQVNGFSPLVVTANTGLLTIDEPNGGNDLLHVSATAGNDAVSVDENAVTVTGMKPINYSNANIEALNVDGVDGDDDFTVTPSANTPPIFIAGGNPVGVAGDTLTVDASGLGVTLHAGPESDAGAVEVTGLAAVSFDEIEGVVIDNAGAAIICGTHGDDQITVLGTAANAATVWVNGNAPIELNGLTSLEIDGKNGDDDIDIDANLLALGDGNFTVSGGSPSADEDVVTLVGADPSWTPTGHDAGQMMVDLQRVDVSNVERVVYDGQAQNETLTVNAPTAAVARFVHTPGNAPDAGRFDITDIGMDMRGLGISYQDLGLQGQIDVVGTVAVNNVLVAVARDSNDTFNVVATTGEVDLHTTLGDHVDLVPTNILELYLDGLHGDDTFNVTGPQPYSNGITLSGGDPSASDIANLTGNGSDVVYNTGTSVQTVSGGGLGTPGAPLTITGIEEVNLDAQAGDIDVNGTAGPDEFHVTPNGANTAEILVDGVNQVLNTDNTGDLTIAEGNAADGDQVTVHGQSGDNTFAVSRAATTGVQVDALKPVLVAANAESLVVNGKSGSDTFNVTGAGGVSLTVDGGDPTGLPAVGLDTLNVTMANGGTTNVDPGATPDAGFVVAPTANEDIAFYGLEMLNVTGTGADTLAVNGTHGNDHITANNDTVWVNDRAPVGFSGFATLSLNGLNGDDTLSVSPATFAPAVTAIFVDGGQPTASDELIVNGTAGNDTIFFTPTDPDAGSVAITGSPTVNFTTTESVIINAGASSDDDVLNINGTAGNDTIVYTPGPTVDSASVRVNSLVPMSFVNLGTGVPSTVNVDGSTGTDAFVYEGTVDADTYSVAGVETIVQNSQVEVNTSNVESYTLQGNGGDDTFNITPVTDVDITVQGDEPGDGSDVLNYTAQVGPQPVTLDLGDSQVRQATYGDVNYSGIETINADASGNTLELEATDGDDRLVVSPAGGNAGVAQNNGASPLVNYSNVSANTLVVDLQSGDDELIVNATVNSDAAITVDVPNELVNTGANGGIVDFSAGAPDALAVDGLAGIDQFTVTPGSIPVFVDGGDPIGMGDVLNLLPAGTPTFSPGPEGDEGGFAIAGAEPVSFDHIEGVTVDLGNVPAQDAVIMGDGADNDITAVGHAANANEVDVQVDNGPIQTYTNALDLTLQGKNGDDDITIDINNPALGVTFNVEGNLPTAGSDELRVTGADGDGADAVSWTPSTGALVVLGNSINVDSVETLIYDGESDGDLLTVNGTAGAETFEHQPGPAVDAGFVGIRVGGGEQLGLHYENVGDASTVTIAGAGGGDSLTALGTGDSDSVAVAFSATDAIDIDLTSAYGTHVDLLTTGVASYDIDTLEGDDDVTVTGLVDASGTFELHGGGPGIGSDTLRVNATPAGGAETITIAPDAAQPDDQDISGLGAVIHSTGFELVRFVGDGADDTLTVDPGNGDNSLLVEAAHPGPWDQVTSDSLPQVDFLGMENFVVDADGQGSDVVTFKTWFLQGAGAANYLMTGNAVDTLVIEGSDGASDAYTVTQPGGVAVTDANGPGVVVTETTGALGHLVINTLGGDDSVTVDNTLGLIVPLVTYDGGTGSDSLTATGSFNVGAATYSPGPDVTEGRLTHDTQTIDFVNLEPVIDLTIASTLTVNGTGAANSINYSQSPVNAAWGRVNVDGFEYIDFANKGTLVLNGHAGDDQIQLNNATTPTGLAAIAVNGGDPTSGSDTVIISGVAGVTDTIDFAPTTDDDAVVTGAGPVPITLATVENAVIDGQGGGDSLTYTSPGGQELISYTPGDSYDSGSITALNFAGPLMPLAFSHFGLPNNTITFADAGGVRADALQLRGTDLDDTFTLTSGGVVDIDGDGFRRTLPINTPGLTDLTLLGLDGDDTFNIPGNHPFPGFGGALAPPLKVEGGNPDSGSDVLNFNGSGAGATTTDFAAQTVTEAGFTPVGYTGIETINLDAGGLATSVIGTAADEDMTVTVFDANSGQVQRGLAVQQNGQVSSELHAPLVNYSNLGGNAIDLDLGGGEDTLIVVEGGFIAPGAAPAAFDSELTVNIPADTVSIVNDPAGAATPAGTVTWVNDADLASVEVFGLEGDDEFDVTPGDATVFIDGGDPIGQTAGDLINIIAGGQAVVFETGPESDEGGFNVGAQESVSFDHIEALGVFSAAKAIILGTNDDDEINVIARTALTNPVQFAGADGTQDFTTSVNASPEILWIDTPLIFIDALSGDDDITVRTPAPPVPGPGSAQWDVDVYVAGGTPSAPATGDRLRVETPYEDNNVTYQPTGPDTGIMSILNAGGLTHSNIYIGPWEVDCSPAPDDTLRSSPGGVEHLHYDGISAEGGFTVPDPMNPPNQDPATAFTDTLTILGNGFSQATANDHFTHTPGGDPDAGRVDVVDATNAQSMLAINYHNIGLGGSVTLDGQSGVDLMRVVGTGQNDVIDVAATTGTVQITLSNAAPRVPVLQTSIETLVLDSLAGDDTTTINEPQPYSAIDVNGGSPDSGSDVLTVIGAAGTAETVSIVQSASNVTNQTISGYAASIDVSGTERIQIAGQSSDPDTLNVLLGEGNNTARVDRSEEVTGMNADQITSDSLPEIAFTGQANFTVTGGAGDDVVTFATWFLAGANGDYRFDGGATDTLVIEGVDGATAAGDDSFTVTNPAMGAFPVDPPVQVTDNNGTGAVVTAVNTSLGRLQLNSLGGDDTVQVNADGSSGSDITAVPITFDGGGGSDLLQVTGSPTTAVDTTTYSPGPATTEGRLLYAPAASSPMTIDFVNLEPVHDNLVAANLVVNGTNAANQINYSQGPGGGIFAGNTGLVSVDGFETYEFENKGTLTLNGLAGSDEINLNNPITPAALTTITVNGGDPTSGSDVLTVNGLLNMDDAISFTPTAGTDNAGNVTGAGPVPVNFATVEALVIDGQRGDGTAPEDVLTTNLPAGVSSTVTLTPGSTPDSGHVQVDSLVPMSFNNLGASGGRLLFTDLGVTADTLIYNGYGFADTFTVPFPGAADTSIALNGQIEVDTTNIEDYQLRGGGGDDLFSITSPSSSIITITAEGGEPGASDQVDFYVNSATAAPRTVAVEYDTATGTPRPDHQTIQQDALGVVTLLGVETANVEAPNPTGAADNLYVAGTRHDDVITYTPLSTNDGNVTVEGEKLEVNFNNFLQGEDLFTITGGSGGIADKVVFVGTNGRDLIAVDTDTSTRTVGLAPLPFTFPAAPLPLWQPVVLDDGAAIGLPAVPATVTGGSIETVTISARDGDDTVHYDPADVVSPGAPDGPGLFVNVDGGQPQASDALVITSLVGGVANPLSAANFVVINQSRIPDAGNVVIFNNAGGTPTRRPGVAYTNVEVVSPNFGLPVLPNPDLTNTNLLVLGPDNYEQNENTLQAAFLGSGETINVENLAIFPNFSEHLGVPADVDYFRVVAEKTGTLDFQVYFNSYAATLLPGGGQLAVDVLDAQGNAIAGATTGTFSGSLTPAAAGTPDVARARIPAVQGQTYYLRVFGANAGANTQNTTVVNGYDITIVNEAPPVPYDIELNDIIEVGTTGAGATTVSIPATTVPVNPVLGAPTVARDYVGKTIEYTTGANAGRQAVITGFAGGVFTVGAGLIANPAVGDAFIVESTDTGRSQFDDVTRDSTPIITFRLDDDILLRDLPGASAAGNPPDGAIPIPLNPLQTAAPGGAPAIANAGYRVPVFIEGNPQQPGTAPQTPIGYARPLAGTPGVYIFDFGVDAIPGAAALVLTNGSHFISAKVEIIDPSIDTVLANDLAFGARSESLEIVVDTVAPTVSFGDPGVPNAAVPIPDGLRSSSDSADPALPATSIDRITNDTTPTFWGQAEADSIVRAYVDITNNGLTPDDVLIGQTVATPLDGTNQHPWGEWEITSTVDMNDPAKLAALGRDGVRNILVTAEDVAGNTSAAIPFVFFLDTAGPTISARPFITGTPGYNLFANKPTPEAPGPSLAPTPAVTSLTIPVSDLPARVAPFIYQAISTVPSPAPFAPPFVGLPLDAIVLTGDANGVIPISAIQYQPTNNGPGIATGNILLFFGGAGVDGIFGTADDLGRSAAPLPGPDGIAGTVDDVIPQLPDDRYTLTIDDSLIDPAGNHLDGENNSVEPNGGGTFPTGDGRPGGDFVARFTVDSVAEIAVVSAGTVWADINGNSIYDPNNLDAVNRDFVYSFGNGSPTAGNPPGGNAFTSDDFVAGDWNGNGYDELAAYGSIGTGISGPWRWLVDTNDNGAPGPAFGSVPASGIVVDPANINGLPVAGNFDAGQNARDEVAVFTGGSTPTWWFDTTGNFNVDTPLVTPTLTGHPVVGDFDGDGFDDLGAYTGTGAGTGGTAVFNFLLTNGTARSWLVGGATAATIIFDSISGVREIPVVHDMDGDGIDDVGLWMPDRAGTSPGEGAEWFFLVSNDFYGIDDAAGNADGVLGRRANGTVATLNHAFSPVPLGNDIYAQFGDEFALPIVGNFDPPAGGGGEGDDTPPVGGDNPLDVNKDGFVTPTDVRVVINDLNANGARTAEPTLPGEKNPDTNRDFFISPSDALRIINFLNADVSAPAQDGGEGEGVASVFQVGLGGPSGTSINYAGWSYQLGTSDEAATDTGKVVSSSKAGQDAEADTLLVPAVQQSGQGGSLADTARNELFASAELDEDLFDSLAHDVSNRQSRSELDDVFGDLG